MAGEHQDVRGGSSSAALRPIGQVHRGSAGQRKLEQHDQQLLQPARNKDLWWHHLCEKKDSGKVISQVFFTKFVYLLLLILVKRLCRNDINCHFSFLSYSNFDPLMLQICIARGNDMTLVPDTLILCQGKHLRFAACSNKSAFKDTHQPILQRNPYELMRIVHTNMKTFLLIYTPSGHLRWWLFLQ